MSKETRYNFKHVLFTLIILQSAFIYEKYRSGSTDGFVIFNKSKASAIAIKKNRKISIYRTANFDESSAIVKSYSRGSNAATIDIIDSVQNIFIMNKKKIIVVDSMGIYKLNKLKPDGLLLRQSPKVNLERVISELNPSFIIADASNYYSYVKYWQLTCLDHNISFHYTARDGAFSENF